MQFCFAQKRPGEREFLTGDLCLEHLVGITWDVFQNILHPASHDTAKVVDRRGSDRPIFSELVNGGTGNMMVFDQCIGGLRGVVYGFPKTFVADHGSTSCL